MPAKIIILALVLYFLTLFQSSFLPHFDIFGYVPNLVIIAVIIIFFTIPSLDFTAAFLGGFLLDIFSSHFFGFYSTILLGILCFIKLTIRRYVRFSFR